VRDAVVRFANWLRGWAEFPIRVPVYLYPAETLQTRHGETVTASFFAPFERDVEPYIRVATGDYAERKARRGRDNALAAILCSLAHEVIHYQQWLATGNTHERGVPRQASAMIDAYARTTDRP
jgi:hypothetical protein